MFRLWGGSKVLPPVSFADTIYPGERNTTWSWKGRFEGEDVKFGVEEPCNVWGYCPISRSREIMDWPYLWAIFMINLTCSWWNEKWTKKRERVQTQNIRSLAMTLHPNHMQRNCITEWHRGKHRLRQAVEKYAWLSDFLWWLWWDMWKDSSGSQHCKRCHAFWQRSNTRCTGQKAHN